MSQLTKEFGKIDVSNVVPHLVNLQLDSYRRFLQRDPQLVTPEEGLESVFRSVFPIEDFNKTTGLEYVSYSVGEPKYDQHECIVKGVTYEVPLRLRVRLVIYDVDEETKVRKPKDIKEQDIYFGTIPLMTDKGTFIINGTERVVVNQLQRSPGIIFEHDFGKTHSSKKNLYSARIIPMRGSWIDFDFDPKDILYVRIDRRRKMPATILLKAMGMTQQDIIDYFYKKEIFSFGKRGAILWDVCEGIYRKDFVAQEDILDETGNVILKNKKVIDLRSWAKLQEHGIKQISVAKSFLLGQFLGKDIINVSTGELLFPALTEVTEDVLDALYENRIVSIEVIYTRGTGVSTSLRDTLLLDKTETKKDAQLEIYRRLRPSSPPSQEIFSSYFDNIFRNSDYYDLSTVGRYKVNQQLALSIPLTVRVLTDEDILKCLAHLVRLKDTHGAPDDIDHLGNRRVRSVGELIEVHYRTGLVRMERAIKERMSLQDIVSLMPHDLINPKPVIAVLKEFFGTSQLSQFMDQTNSLSEVTHKRRLSALGPGGLTRERAGFEVRDVHNSHYGRICPIETPEGPNIGLIVSLTTYAKVNDYGFIETPYRVVKNSQLTEEIVYLDALCEVGAVIAGADVPIDDNSVIIPEMVHVRDSGEITVAPREAITYTDISPGQMVSISAALIPFLEHDDANRALMGSNMQRQAVPLLRCERALVGTGMEGEVARDSCTCVIGEDDGIVRYVDANRIIVTYNTLYRDQTGVKVYELQKYHKSNQNSCFGQKPICNMNQVIKKGDILADGPAIHLGELALGKNLTVAFMPWCGFNFEDSILISERCVKEDIFTSVHIEEFEILARDTKLGPEEITRDIPNVNEEMLKDIDMSGIIRIGALVKQDSILVGKITPKGETQLTPEEKLLRAIFGDKARDVKNTSLKVPPGVEGTVIDVKVFNRRSGDKDERAIEIENDFLLDIDKKELEHIRALISVTKEEILQKFRGEKVVKNVLAKNSSNVLLAEGSLLSKEILEKVDIKSLEGIFDSRAKLELLHEIIKEYSERISFIKRYYLLKKERFLEGDDLPPGVIKMVKVYVAVKRKLSVGDKMAGRHGNKGVVSCILPVEDMPFFADGRSVDIVLNPLGVPSRMNIGQIMETHLGWAAQELGIQLSEMLESGVAQDVLRSEVKSIFSSSVIDGMIDEMSEEELHIAVKDLRGGIITKTPVFDGAREEEIWNWLKRASLQSDGKSLLYDGRTGEPFHQRVTTGIMYMMKLHHLVDEKIHARSTGPYSLVTQQPLGGKAQFGGQRLGEMEVWALEAYGAAYLLQEFLTVKSDDVLGRVRMYEKIVKRDNFLEAGLPESFNVLIKELMSLGINVLLHQEEEKRSVKHFEVANTKEK
ncbi:MAG: DNA-directed RNA polymerase subunit beta [Desulfovibrionaceae bacterium]